MKIKFLTKNILLLSFVSFFTDIASEIIYPILPLYFTSIGLSYLAVGFIEGLAQLIASLSKVYFGLYSDKLQNRTIFLNLGYGISAFAKPVIGLTSSLWIILFARLTDRFSKGIRTSPRDAILIEESKEENRAKVFSFHRSLDTLGAAIGPIIAIFVLMLTNNNYALLFQLTIIPGLIALFLTFAIKIKDKNSATKIEKKSVKQISFSKFLKQAPMEYRNLLLGFLLFAFVNVTDFFILLRIRDLLIINNSYGFTIPLEYLVILFYIAYNLLFVAFANIIGYLSDKFNHKITMLFGIVLLGLIFSLISQNLSIFTLVIVIIFWSIFANINDSVSKAWISLYIPKEYKATGVGLLATTTAVATFLGNIFVGLLIQTFNFPVAFSIISLFTIPIFLYFFSLKFVNKQV